MHRRLRVLISAYACEPDKGSEPEVGWQWALQMARFHDVTVLTRANNKPGIEAKLATLRGQRPVPTFVYHEESNFLQGTKQRLSSLKLYYVLWQRSAREVIAQRRCKNLSVNCRASIRLAPSGVRRSEGERSEPNVAEPRRGQGTPRAKNWSRAGHAGFLLGCRETLPTQNITCPTAPSLSS